MRFRAPMIAVVLLAALAVPAAELGAGGGAPSGKRPLQSLPYTPSLDVSSMDRSVDPCVDLYAYSCGGWMKANPIPPDQARWTVYDKLQDENQQYLWGILDAVAAPDPSRSPVRAKIGDYFASCMDEEAVERAGTAPIESYLRALAALRSKEEVAGLLARLHLATGSGAAVRLRRQPGPEELGAGDRVRPGGRAGLARSRLLLEEGRQVPGNAVPLRGARPEDAGDVRRRPGGGGPGGAGRASDRDRAGEGVADSRRDARSLQDLPQDEGRGPPGDHPLLPLERLPGRPRGAGDRRTQRHRAEILRGAREADQEGEPRRLEELPALAPRDGIGRRTSPPRS